MDPKPPLRKLAAVARYCPSCLHPRPILHRPQRALLSQQQQQKQQQTSFSTTTRTTQRLHIASPASSPADRPRWESTPVGMSLPFSVRPKHKNTEWKCNSSPAKLDAMYRRLLGEDGGDLLLSEEVKWLAVTHKSFDQGRRGFNDRLSYLGKRIVDLQTSAALVSASESPLRQQGPDEFGRVPYQHPQLSGLSNLSDGIKAEVLSKARMAQLASKYGIMGVMRWQPKKVDNLAGSGIELVLSQTLYAIVGAIALEKGGELAIKITREKILKPLGVVS